MSEFREFKVLLWAALPSVENQVKTVVIAKQLAQLLKQKSK